MEFFSVSPEIEEAGEAVGKAYEKLGDFEGHNVTIEQIGNLLAARLHFVYLESRDQNFRKIGEHGAESMKKIYGVNYPLQEEQSDLMQSQPLSTPEAAQAAKTWFARTKDLASANIAINKTIVQLHAVEDIDATMDLILEYERRNKSFDEAIKLLEERFNLTYDSDQFLRDMLSGSDEESTQADGLVGDAWNNLGERKGENVTFEQIETLLNMRLAALTAHSSDPKFIRMEDWSVALMVDEFGENARFTWEEELKVLRTSVPLTTVEAVQAAITWFIKSKELIRINRIASRENFERSGDESYRHVVIDATRRMAACDNAIKLLRERFNIEA